MFSSRTRFVAMVVASLTLLGVLLTPMGVSAQGNSEAAKACQKGGYTTLQGPDGTRFANTGECVSYAARGGELVEILPQSLEVTFLPSSNASFCLVQVELISYPATTEVPVTIVFSDQPSNPFVRSMTTDGLGHAVGTPVGSYFQFGPTVTVEAGGLTSGPLDISC